MTATPAPAPDTYAIAGRPGRDCLRLLSSVMAPSTTALLVKVGVPCNARVLDLGCGGGDVAAVLSKMASVGHVAGVDFDPAVIEIARAEARAAGLRNVELRVGDVTDLDDEDGQYDVVHARFLLSHLREPAPVLRRMVALCKPGGAVVVQDIDIEGSMCWPDDAAFAQCCSLYRDTVRARGGDAGIGRRLPSMLRDAGARAVEATVLQPGGLTGDAKRIQLVTLTNIAASAMALGLITSAGVERLTRQMTAFVERDDTFVTTARVVQAWGRRA